MADIVPSIPEFFKNRDIFITGGTGFMGKVLIEKLLRSCPDIGNIYCLMREKKGASIGERVTKITSLPLFDLLKSQQPDFLAKIVPVEGDVKKLGLDIGEENLQKMKNVSVIFHVAASVRFDDHLKDAVFMNTRSTREVMKLALTLPLIKAVLHVSTTYSNTDRDVIEEKIHQPPHADWRKTIEIVEKVDSHVLDILTPKYMGKLPNTYTFTKSLAEHVVNDYNDQLPVIVFRPSIVISSESDPMPGWIDNFNGPVGLLVASGKGIMRSVFTSPDLVQDYMPVDFAIKAMIIAAWDRGTKSTPPPEIPVYNCSSNDIKRVTMHEMLEMGKKIAFDTPFNGVMWYPGGGTTTCKSWHYIKVILFHLLPAILIDQVLKFNNMQPMLVRLQRRIYVANLAVNYFLINTWVFKNEKLLALERSIKPTDRAAFGINLDVDVFNYLRDAMIGARLYLMKEPANTLDQARRHYRRMYWLDRITTATFATLFIYFVFIKCGVAESLLQLIGFL